MDNNWHLQENAHFSDSTLRFSSQIVIKTKDFITYCHGNKEESFLQS